MNKFSFFSIALVATALVAMERSPEWTDDDFEDLRQAYKRQKRFEANQEEVKKTVAQVETREKQKRRAFNVMKLINKRLEEQHGE